MSTPRVNLGSPKDPQASKQSAQTPHTMSAVPEIIAGTVILGMVAYICTNVQIRAGIAFMIVMIAGHLGL